MDFQSFSCFAFNTNVHASSVTNSTDVVDEKKILQVGNADITTFKFDEFSFFSDWYLVLERIRDHPDFGHFFVEYPGDTTWMEANLFDGDTTGDNRIPYDILSLPAAEVVFKNIVNQLHAHNHQLE